MKIAIVNSKDVFDRNKNPTLCLSALRGTGECHRCDKIAKRITHTALAEVIKELKCKPNFGNVETLAILKEYDELLQEQIELQEKINLARKRLSLKGE